MKRICQAAVALVMTVTASSVSAASAKEKDCGYQADIVAAVQKARLDRVREKDVTEVVLAGEVTWPENYNAAIPIFAGEVYKLKMRDLRNSDQGAAWRKLCLAN